MPPKKNESRTIVCRHCGRTFASLGECDAHHKIPAAEGYTCASPMQLRRGGFIQQPPGVWRRGSRSELLDMGPPPRVEKPKPPPKPRPDKPKPKTVSGDRAKFHKGQRVRIRVVREVHPNTPPEAVSGTGVVVSVNRARDNANAPYTVDIDGLEVGSGTYPANRYNYQEDELVEP